MPRRNTIDTITLGIFIDENVSVICEDTIKLEKVSVAVLSGNSEVGKSFLALEGYAILSFHNKFDKFY